MDANGIRFFVLFSRLLGNPLHEFDFHGKFTDPNFNPWWSVYFLGGIDRF